jgi:hypothetical protein
MAFFGDVLYAIVVLNALFLCGLIINWILFLKISDSAQIGATYSNWFRTTVASSFLVCCLDPLTFAINCASAFAVLPTFSATVLRWV